MTTEERKAVREALIAQGFNRTSYTQDFGDGIYSETWTRTGASIVIQWGAKVREEIVEDQRSEGVTSPRYDDADAYPTWVC